jgi:hypothetical protein
MAINCSTTVAARVAVVKTPVWITHCSARRLSSDVAGAAAACVSTCGGRGTARSVAGDERNTSGPIAVSIPAGRATVGSVTGPAYCTAEHNIGNIAMTVANDGSFGNGWSLGGTVDCFTGQAAKSCEYPKGTYTTYLWGADLWVGAVRERDTLVSTCGMGGHEFHPDEAPMGSMVYRSSVDPAKPEYEGAVSEQDYIAVYADTCTNCRGIGTDYLDGRRHVPLGIRVRQSSYAWSYSYAQDFILDFAITNIGDNRLRQVYAWFLC